MKVCVLGAGVVGATAAYYLSQAGHRVTVIDRQDAVGLETSFANGGQISASHSAPWAAPNAPFLMLKWFGKEDAPLLYHLKADPVLWWWSIGFLRNCTSARLRKNTLNNLRLALYSRKLIKDIRRDTDINYDVKTLGILQIYRDTKTMDKAVTHATLLHQLGCRNTVLGQKSCFELEPALKESGEKIVGGIHTPEDESGDAYGFTREIARTASNSGVNFRFGETIEPLTSQNGQINSVKTDKGEYHADAFVLALGSYSPLLLKLLEIKLPIYPTKGYSVTIPTSGRNNAPNTSITDEDNKIVYSRLGNRLRVAGTAEFSGYDTELNESRARAILVKAEAQFPNGGDFKNAALWTGLRPLTPDGMPVIGKTPIKNLYLNTGHGTLGWTMCASSGKVIADLVSGTSPEIDVKCFEIKRF